MPELTWVGKDKVITHHLDVPFRVLDRQYSFDEDGQHETDNGSNNMIIHGDNLEALKALLPKYEGKIDCIYIDPPYNTGEEQWVYNDSVNDPRIRKWLGEVVGKEGEDLSRHDKWLCMMYPRLRLLHRLLKQDGLIAVSIDDNELTNLGCIMDEIFGSMNRLACAPVRSEPSGGKGKKALRTGHEYLLFYSKGDQSALVKEEKSVGKLDLKDSRGPYRKGRELRKWGSKSDRGDRPSMWFEITAPDGTVVTPIKNDGTEGRWRWGLSNPVMQELLLDPEVAHWEQTSYDDGVVVEGETARWVPYEKIRDAKKAFGWNTWLDGYGTNADATTLIKSLFGSKEFDTPKPLSLVEWIVLLHENTNGIILDSFAGSGTTAHAVLKVNKEERSHRSFILVELGEYAESITAGRVKRVIDGYGEGKKRVEGTGGSFSFYELGAPLLVEGNLNHEVPLERVREYIWFTETGEAYRPEARQEHADYLGRSSNNTSFFFAFDGGALTVLDRVYLSSIPAGCEAESYVIYADTCLLTEQDLVKHNITFKKIPRDITRL
ncbi:site-specific DNA-methyltransferase [Corynebacterium lujinxingii]|uniref:Site-specific DNA-methyltransferase n=1 Tax=Corynebacterium lujinxingii TaxID=2763010 RepID=A0A7H0JZL2_9CORY|nr:site-specific DNA-methyltransferase [Corynebacterium lujinxingii]MBC3179654.1 site-specific DNA-methyltransferase [Corynebacterium lujinxingii]NNO10346.1 site-specific DNA-methyltransferase [Corynebacterium lujinxingii]QNP90478.1 site-specific DNA-methyltransferase [Corynebacterium lujinxingii]